MYGEGVLVNYFKISDILQTIMKIQNMVNLVKTCYSPLNLADAIIFNLIPEVVSVSNEKTLILRLSLRTKTL